MCPNGDIVLRTQPCQQVIAKEIKKEIIIFYPIENLIDLSVSNLDFRKEVISVTPTEIQVRLYFSKIESVSEEDLLQININFDFVRIKNPSVTINLESLVTRNASSSFL